MSRCGAVAVLGVLWTSAARADSNDLVLGRLATRSMDSTGQLVITPQNLEFRELASQLGVVLAPRLLTPADTLGFGGFQFAVDAASTTIDSTASYWRAREGAPDPTGMGTGTEAAKQLRTVGFFARKGLWFPIPSLEVDLGAVHLVDSHDWTGQLSIKLALQEGYHELPLPSVAIRGGVSRLFNQRELDLTVASFDILISKHIGVGGTWHLDPFAGWNLLSIIPRSQVIDPTPNIDPLQKGNEDDSKLNFVFKDQSNITRQRFVIGTKLQYYVFQITLEAIFALQGTSVDDRTGTDQCMPFSTTTNCDSKDDAKAQRTLSISGGFDF
jgi:hypothetical protein